MPERLSIVTDEISQDLAECGTFLAVHGIHAVELRVIGSRRVPDLDPADLETLRAWARGGDPEILGVSPGTFKCRADDRAEARRQLAEVLPRAIELAKDLRARFLVTFGFENPTGAAPDGFALESLGAAAAACADAGLPLLVENEPGFLAGTASETVALIRAVGHENLKANWDPLNGNEHGEAELSAALDEVFPFARHVHVKNGVRKPGRLLADGCALRSGAIDWPAHLRRLGELGYAGHLGVETHFEPLPESSAIVIGELREMIEEVGFTWGTR